MSEYDWRQPQDEEYPQPQLLIRGPGGAALAFFGEMNIGGDVVGGDKTVYGSTQETSGAAGEGFVAGEEYRNVVPGTIIRDDQAPEAQTNGQPLPGPTPEIE